MDYFNSRLAELEEEQEELREYQNVDRKIRAIQLTLYRTAVTVEIINSGENHLTFQFSLSFNLLKKKKQK